MLFPIIWLHVEEKIRFQLTTAALSVKKDRHSRQFQPSNITWADPNTHLPIYHPYPVDSDVEPLVHRI